MGKTNREMEPRQQQKTNGAKEIRRRNGLVQARGNYVKEEKGRRWLVRLEGSIHY